MLISLHLPKTAGSSFRKALEDHFGDRLLMDYGDRPINTPACQRKLSALSKCCANGFADFTGIRCVHGHFLPLKYRAIGLQRKAVFVTWIRDPVERFASHYYFWKRRRYDPDNAPYLYKKMIEEKWSLERFCFAPELKNYYTRFLWGFPIQRFDFIGITEYYEEDLEFFSDTFLDRPLPRYQKNSNPDREQPVYITDIDFRKKLEAHHDRDTRLYRQALEKRLDRYRNWRRKAL